MPILEQLAINRAYALDASTIRLVGTANENLVKKFSFDSSGNQWQFNKDGLGQVSQNSTDLSGSATVPAALQSQIGGAGKKDASLYSVNLPSEPTKGITYFDNNTNLSFSLVPQFATKAGKEQQGRIVYPFENGGKLVYTAMNNGMKEDIVLSHNIGDTLELSYKLNLPDTLEAKLLADGSVGVYSADPALFGNIQFGSDSDRTKVETARTNATKDHLLFALPAPVIKDSGSGKLARADFFLDGDQLTVKASGLNNLTYPLSVDPSVVITSSSDFTTGNNEGNIDFASGQINRGAVTGGNPGNGASANWTSASNNFTTARFANQSFAYNGYLYMLAGGDSNSGTKYADIQCSAINSSDGSLGSWATSSNTVPTPGGTGRQRFSLAIYNGYVFIAGGNVAGNTNDVYSASIVGGSTCIGTFSSALSSFTTVRQNATMTAYNGYLYIAGGQTTGNTILADIQYAAINADGTIGTWNTATAYSTGRYNEGLVAYNGYLYIYGGKSTGAFQADTQYTKIASDGSLGTWATTTSFTTGRFGFYYGVYNGYLYLSGGSKSGGTDATDTQYAQINANGTIGAWLAGTSSLSTGRDTGGVAAYNGYLYFVGGEDATPTMLSTTLYAKIDPPGTTTNFTTDTHNTTTNSRNGAASFAYHGFLYVFGGAIAGTSVATVNKTAISDSGVLGSWSTSTAMGTATSSFAFAYYNGVVYVIGGLNSSGTAITTVQYASFNFSGTLTWSTTTVLPAAAAYHSAAAFGGYLFTVGTSASADNQVRAAPINNDGTIGSWTTQTQTFTTSRSLELMLAYNGYLYILGGQDASTSPTTTYSDIQIAPLNTASPGSAATVISGAFSTSSNAMSNSRAQFGAAIVNGYMYALGGTHTVSSVTTSLSSVEYSLINSNGTLGTWASAPAMTSTMSNFGLAVSNGQIYMVNGLVAGSGVRTASYVTVNNGGSGYGSTFTTASNSLASQYATGVGYVQTFAANGYLYVVGGYDGTSQHAQTYSAAINVDGSLGVWGSTGSLNTGRYDFGMAVSNGYVYVGGGQTGAGRANSIEYAAIGTNGSLSWTTSSTSFTTTRSSLAMAAYNGYIYVLGGAGATTTRYNDVQYAKVPTAGGELASDAGCGSAWCTTTSFTTPRGNLSAVAYNGYLYMLAGNDSTSYYSDVQYASINSNGTVNSWGTTTRMAQARQGFGAVVTNGYLYVVGGVNSSTSIDDMEFAPILANGTIGEWQFAGTMPGGRRNQNEVAMYNGFVYSVGGVFSGTYFSDIQYSALSVQPRIGQFSKLIDLGNTYNLSAMTYNGTLPNGLSAISLKVAGTNGVFGSSLLASSLTAPAACTTSATRYILLSVTIDDSQSIATYADSLGTMSTLTDLTVNYNTGHPTPSTRLFGGKYFNNQSLQPLDTCGS